jgi:hypothetical protein
MLIIDTDLNVDGQWYDKSSVSRKMCVLTKPIVEAACLALAVSQSHTLPKLSLVAYLALGIRIYA